MHEQNILMFRVSHIILNSIFSFFFLFMYTISYWKEQNKIRDILVYREKIYMSFFFVLIIFFFNMCFFFYILSKLRMTLTRTIYFIFCCDPDRLYDIQESRKIPFSSYGEVVLIVKLFVKKKLFYNK